MKRGLLLTAAMLLVAGFAFGQAGAIGTYADPAGLNCNVTPTIGATLSIFVVHTLTPGATGSQFSAAAPLCMIGAVHLSDTVVFPVTVGNSQTGVAIGYGACFAGPIHVLTINYFLSGATPLCCEYVVAADPNAVSGQIEVVLCAGLAFGVGLTNTVNGTPDCPCSVPLPVEEMSWGRVKAMYGESRLP